MRVLSLQYVRKRSGGEVHVEFEDGTKLVVDPDLTVKFQLARGLVLSEDRHRELCEAQEKLSARRRLIRNLSLRKKTARESEHYLRTLKFPEHAIEYAISAARENGYLNDEEYAEAYTRAQERSAKKGPRAIRQELQARGVEREIAKKAVEHLTDADMQRAAARALGCKKAQSLARETDRQKAKVKLHQYLVRKGYDVDVALEVTRELLGRQDEDITDVME